MELVEFDPKDLPKLVAAKKEYGDPYFLCKEGDRFFVDQMSDNGYVQYFIAVTYPSIPCAEEVEVKDLARIWLIKQRKE